MHGSASSERFVKVELNWIYLANDHDSDIDGEDPGEIFVELYIDDEKIRVPAEGNEWAITDQENVTLNCVLYAKTTTATTCILELQEADETSNEKIGSIMRRSAQKRLISLKMLPLPRPLMMPNLG